MKTLSTIQAQQKWREADVSTTYISPNENTKLSLGSPDQIQSLVETIKLYRAQEQAYFEKIKRKEFAKDELHHMKKTQEKLDRMLTTINL